MAYKCAGAGCTCSVNVKGMYCSPQCASKGPGNASCVCGHASCKASGGK